MYCFFFFFFFFSPTSILLDWGDKLDEEDMPP
jgi:hypothetical protein